jgi:hypothetical protein
MENKIDNEKPLYMTEEKLIKVFLTEGLIESKEEFYAHKNSLKQPEADNAMKKHREAVLDMLLERS